jgi:hypothetical protein
MINRRKKILLQSLQHSQRGRILSQVRIGTDPHQCLPVLHA